MIVKLEYNKDHVTFIEMHVLDISMPRLHNGLIADDQGIILLDDITIVDTDMVMNRIEEEMCVDITSISNEVCDKLFTEFVKVESTFTNSHNIPLVVLDVGMLNDTLLDIFRESMKSGLISFDKLDPDLTIDPDVDYNAVRKQAVSLINEHLFLDVYDRDNLMRKLEDPKFEIRFLNKYHEISKTTTGFKALKDHIRNAVNTNDLMKKK